MISKPHTVAQPLRDGSQPGPIKAPPAEAQAASFHELRGKSSHRAATLAGIGVPMADCPASFLSNDPRPMTGFLAALSEAGRKAALEYDGPETHGDMAYALDPCLSAQRAMGIC